MKIGPFANVIPFPSAGEVRSKRSEGEGGHARQQYDSPKDQGDGQKREKQEPFDPQLIEDAIRSFKDDSVTQEHGLNAVVEGVGPGLKVYVKDCNGTTLRQFSGEEFLRLREATSGTTGKRGKLIDQKL